MGEWAALGPMVEGGTIIHAVLCSFIQQALTECLLYQPFTVMRSTVLSTSCVPGTVLGPEDTAVT